MPVSEDEVEHEQVQQQGGSVCDHDGNVVLNDAVDQPKRKSCDEHQVHANRYIFHLLGLPGFPDLRSHRSGGARARYQS